MENTIVPILMYHSIRNVPTSEVMRSLHVKPQAFALQMWILKKLGYRGCSVSEAICALSEPTGEKLVALTFDDGYENFLSNALPILDRFGFSATIYVLSDLIGAYNQWDLDSGISKNTLMTEDQIRQCLRHGMEVGCHGATHLSLLDPSANLETEITQAKQNLEAVIQQPATTFCYPYGHFDDKAVRVVERNGFGSAVTMTRSRARGDDDLFRLPRIPVTWHTLPHLFLAKILTNYEDQRRHA